MAINQATGDIYVADSGNNRIQQISSSGAFIRAWGTDVVQAGKPGDTGTGFEICTVASDCKAGTAAGGSSGQVAQPMGLVIDQSNGFVYVISNTNRRVDVFSSTGAFAGAFGWGVDTGAGALEICTITTSCQAGVAGAAAGQFPTNLVASSPAFDPTAPGVIYVPEQGNARVSKFSTSISGGELQSATFIKAFGWDVAPGAVNEEQEVRVRAASGQFKLSFDGDATADLSYDDPAAAIEGALNALPSISAGGGSVSVTGGPGNPTGATPYVIRFDGGPLAGIDVAELTASGGASPLSGGTPSSGASVLTRANGGSTATLESCTSASGCKIGATGGGSGQFTGSSPATSAGSPSSAAVDSTGAVYLVSGPFNGPNNDCTVTAPCRIQKFNPSTTEAKDFGPVSGPGQITNTTSLTSGEVAALDVAVDLDNDHVFVNLKNGTTSYRVAEYDNVGNFVEAHPSTDLTSTAATFSHGLAVGPDETLASALTGTSVYLLGPVPDPIPSMEAVTDIGLTTATFEGSVEIPPPGAPTFTTTFHFEYSTNGVDEWVSTPVPDAPVGNGSTGVHAVSRSVSGLEPNQAYFVRLVATTGAEGVSSSIMKFTTGAAPPNVGLTYAEDVTQTTATLGAHVDPQGAKATYHFEWASQEEWESVPGNYGHRVPAFERHLGSGNEAIIVNEAISGLRSAGTYHFRVVTSNANGTVEGPDQTFETLNSCGLVDGRCYELVSPATKGPVGAAGDLVSYGQELRFQAAPDSAAIAYEIAYGLPGSTASGEVLHEAKREPTGWASTQLSPPMPEVPGSKSSDSSRARLLADDLECGAYVSLQPLTADTPTAPLDAGHGNLFRRAASGEWTPISNVEPSVISSQETLGATEYEVIGMSENCERVIFRSDFQYPGRSGAGTYRLYEWNDGALTSISQVPGSDDPMETVPGAPLDPGDSSVGDGVPANYWGAVSADASRIYYTARSAEGGDLGQNAVFLREGEGVVKDISQSQAAALPGGAPNDDDAVFQTASDDGSRAFFIGRYGLATNASGDAVESSSGAASCASNGTGCDLYRYSVDDGRLVDLSVPGADTSNPRGASVVGVLGADEDGSHVYFAARGQLTADKGSTEQENLAAATYNIYLSEGGSLSYVGRLSAESANALIGSSQDRNRAWSSRVTPDGEYLLFESRANVTGFDSEGKSEAYLYSADTDTTQCVSCRRDGLPSAADSFRDLPLTNGADVWNFARPPRMLTDDGQRVFFMSPNRLASGATEGTTNLYQWEQGQISFIANTVSGSGYELQLAGASSNGDDLYFTTLDQLTWDDIDGQMDIYDARVGGGFPRPPVTVPCDPLSEASCQAGGASIPNALAPPASSVFVGPGNLQNASAPKKKKPKKHKKKSGGKKAKGKNQKKGKNRRSRNAKLDGRGAK